MPLAQREIKRRKWCDDCDRYVLAVEQQPNYSVHVLIAFMTCGLYLPLMLVLLAVGEIAPTYLCSKCGDRCR